MSARARGGHDLRGADRLLATPRKTANLEVEDVADVQGVDLQSFDAVVFDMDGVVTDTAAVHAAAWKRLFDEYLAQRSEREGGEAWRPFNVADDYRPYVDGKPRYDGVRDLLAGRYDSRGNPLGSMAGSVDFLQRVYAGVGTRDDMLVVNPRLPDEIRHVSLTVHYRGHRLRVDGYPDRLRLRSYLRPVPPIRVLIAHSVVEIAAGASLEYPLTALTPGRARSVG